MVLPTEAVMGFVPKTGKPGLDETVVTKAFTMSLER